MAKNYAFLGAFSGPFVRTISTQTKTKNKRLNPNKWFGQLTGCLVAILLSIAWQPASAQSYSAAYHSYSNVSAEICDVKTGVFSVVYHMSPTFQDTTRIQYISHTGKLKAMASLARNEYTGVRSMIATSDACALVAGYATGCDYLAPNSHYFLSKVDSSGSVLFSITVLSSSISLGATGLAEDPADSTYYVYLPNKMVHVSKTGVILQTSNCAGNYMLGKRFSNGDVIAVHNYSLLTYGDSVGFSNFYSQPLISNAKQIKVNSNDIVYVLTANGIEKFDAQMQPQGTYTAGGQLTAIDIHNDTLYIAGHNNNLAFLHITDASFSVISQYTTGTKYLMPTGITGILGKSAALSMTGNNQSLFTEYFTNVSRTDKSGGFSFSNDISLIAASVINVSIAAYVTSSPTIHTLYLNMDVALTVKNNGPDTVKSFYVSSPLYSPAICGRTFMHLPQTLVIPPQGTVVVQTGNYPHFLGWLEAVTVPTTYSVPPICMYTSIPNNTADFNPDNDYLCLNVGAAVPMLVQGIATQANIENGFTLYPNPAQDKVTLVSEEAAVYNYKLYNSLGQLCSQAQGQGSIDIDCTSFVKGIYFLQIESAKGTQQKKLVIQ